MPISPEPRDPADFPNWRFATLDFDYDPATRSVWMSFKADGPPCFTFQTLKDLKDIGASLRNFFSVGGVRHSPIHYVALASNKPGIFNLGGDLAVFAEAIRDKDPATLKAYAHACIDVLHAAASGYDLPIIVIAVIGGRAFGGGFEAALAHDVLFAEVGATVGVPEVAFNTFPGMGAVTLLKRRIGLALTEKVIADGKIHQAQEMFDLGVIDHVTPDGQAAEVARAWMLAGGEPVRARRLALVRARRLCMPVSRSELIGIVDVWAECSLGIGQRDLRHMDRLIAAQRRMEHPHLSPGPDAIPPAP